MDSLIAIEYLTVLGITMVLLFMDSRYSLRCTLAATGCTILLVMAAVAFLYCVCGVAFTLRVYTLVAHIPSFLLLFALSRYRGWRLIFQLFSAVLFCTLIQHAVGLLFYFSGKRVWVLVLSYLVCSSCVILFLVRFLRPLFLKTLSKLHHGWWLICTVMATYYVIVIYVIPGYVGIDRSSTILKSAISVLMVGFYWVLLFLFSNLQKESEIRHSAQISALQLSALQSRMEAVKAAEDVIRRERHDLRHRLQVVSKLVEQGHSQEALNFLDEAQRRLDEQKEMQWCRSPVLDAVLSSYFDQAKNLHITVDAVISLPDTLKVPEGELAIVVANVLENAIHANVCLPEEERKIFCRMIGVPSVILEVSNPCSNKVVFDSNGLPIAQRKGHGFGVQSIAAFCKKNGAAYQFEVKEGRFWCRIVL